MSTAEALSPRPDARTTKRGRHAVRSPASREPAAVTFHHVLLSVVGFTVRESRLPTYQPAPATAADLSQEAPR